MESSYHPILYIENDENIIALFKHALVEAAIANPLQIVKTGERAFTYLSGQLPFEKRKFYPLPCLIVLELNVPGVDGIELLRWRQTQSQIRCIPVLVLTSSSESQRILDAYDAGANGYLLKTSEPEGMIAIVKAISAFWFLQNTFAPLIDEAELTQSLPTIGVQQNLHQIGASAWLGSGA